MDQGGRRWVAAAIQDAGGRPGWSRQDPLPLSSALVGPKLTFTSVSIAYRCVALCTSVCSFPRPFLFLARGQEKTRPETRDFYTPARAAAGRLRQTSVRGARF